VPLGANLTSPDGLRRAGFTMLDSGTLLKQTAAALFRGARLCLLRSAPLRPVEVRHLTEATVSGIDTRQMA
jgi:hypothetical protein